MGPLLARGLSQDFVPLKSRCIKGLAEWILTSPCQRNIIVLAGAGASTAAGIPDFRSPGTGLYDNLQKYNLPTPESIFSLDYFRKAPDAFYELAKDLWPGVQGRRPEAEARASPPALPLPSNQSSPPHMRCVCQATSPPSRIDSSRRWRGRAVSCGASHRTLTVSSALLGCPPSAWSPHTAPWSVAPRSGVAA